MDAPSLALFDSSIRFEQTVPRWLTYRVLTVPCVIRVVTRLNVPIVRLRTLVRPLAKPVLKA